MLSDWEIRREVSRGRIKITPYDASLVNPNSIDFRLGIKFGKVVASWGHDFIDPLDPESFATLWDEQGQYILEPKEFILGCSLERIVLPDDLVFTVKGRSSVGRLGVENSSCAGHIDSGFPGFVTLEIFNYSDNRVKLTPGMKIGQFTIHRCNPSEKPYYQTGRYVDQGPGQGSKGI